MKDLSFESRLALQMGLAFVGLALSFGMVVVEAPADRLELCLAVMAAGSVLSIAAAYVLWRAQRGSAQTTRHEPRPRDIVGATLVVGLLIATRAAPHGALWGYMFAFCFSAATLLNAGLRTRDFQRSRLAAAEIEHRNLPVED